MESEMFIPDSTGGARRRTPAIGRGLAAVAGCLAALAAGGCSSRCDQYMITSEMDKTLSESGTHAIPIFVYFVQPGGDGFSITEWFKNPMDYNSRIDVSRLIATKAVAGHTSQVKTPQLRVKLEKVCIWAGNPNPEAAGGRPERFWHTVEAFKIQGCAFEILVTGDGVSVKSNNVVLVKMEGAP
jgi:hypothetical protein